MFILDLITFRLHLLLDLVSEIRSVNRTRQAYLFIRVVSLVSEKKTDKTDQI